MEIVLDPKEAGLELLAPLEEDLLRQGPLSQDQVREFYENGVVIVPGLLQGDLLHRAMEVRRDLTSFLPNGETYGVAVTEAWRQQPVFQELALRSPLAEAAEQLTPPRERGDGPAKERPLRVLRDAFFSMAPGQRGCGWHVDDSYFWPAKRDGPGPGVNVWVALDEVKVGQGGGLAFAPGSHRPGFLPHRAVIRQPGPYPQTCEMKTLSPESHESLEAIKVCPALQPGDAIVLTRFLFHRGDPFVDASGEPIARYSVRYVPDCTELEGMNSVVKDGQRSFVNVSAVKIGEAGEELGHFPATDVGKTPAASGGA
eukprot:TRINITY_DN14072_c0_g1_i2.p1 TRINITY_DN14072_c0_g1~~TRINITY_DN14072_c0_g1_i2.p1  ORF type:complete len:313 (+),score=46.91 TRINITY_DN14072_c0_g1_i2:104-1042(+)